MDGEATGTTKCWIEEELEVLILGEALVESAKVDIFSANAANIRV